MIRQHNRARALFGAVGLAAILAVPASATRVDLLVYENADNANTAVLDLWVDVLPSVGGVDFVFHNDGTDGVVTAVYFEGSAFAGALSGGVISAESAGVDFSVGATPPNPAQPGFLYGGSWLGNLFSADANPPPSTKGINHGGTETLTISFSLSGATVADVVAALNDGSFRIAQHVQSIGTGDFSVWTINPAPGSVALLGLAGFAARRRR